MRLRVTLHNFATNPRNRKARDGANFAYAEYVRILQAHEGKGIRLQIHDFKKLCTDDGYAYEILSQCDCVVSNVGPLSFIYFYMREKFHLSFRIIRDVRTALWNGYMFQESLVYPYLRPEDSVIFSSIYSRDLFRRLFPHIPPCSMFVCYPLMRSFPERSVFRGISRESKTSPIIIGYVGRLTDDKNFSQALDLIIELQKRFPNRFCLRAIGEDLSPHYQKDYVVQKLKTEIGSAHIYEWVPPVSYSDIWNEYGKMDLLFFPSTSNLETFGRVLIEATYWGLPVLSSTHAAAPELICSEALMPTRYYTGVEFDAHLAHQLGEVDIQATVAYILDNKTLAKSDYYTRYQDHDQLFVAIVRDGNAINDRAAQPVSTEIQNQFIQAITISDLEVLNDKASGDQICRALCKFLAAVQDYGNTRYYASLLHLFLISNHKAKTLDFIKRSLTVQEDFTNVGGIDLQMSHFLKFYPHFHIDEITV